MTNLYRLEGLRALRKGKVKEKKITITSEDITQKQWSNLILELNLIKKAWSSYATIQLQGPGVRNIIAHGTRNFDSKVMEDE